MLNNEKIIKIETWNEEQFSFLNQLNDVMKANKDAEMKQGITHWDKRKHHYYCWKNYNNIILMLYFPRLSTVPLKICFPEFATFSKRIVPVASLVSLHIKILCKTNKLIKEKYNI